MARIGLYVVRLYQLIVSPVLHVLCGPSFGCRFQPTCSCYASDALRHHGFFKGSWLSLRRILRCHPWNPGGYDPVPDSTSAPRDDIAPPFDSKIDG